MSLDSNCSTSVQGSQVSYKEGCVFPVVAVSIPPLAEFRPHDHREDAPRFIKSMVRVNSEKFPIFDFSVIGSKIIIRVNSVIF